MRNTKQNASLQSMYNDNLNLQANNERRTVRETGCVSDRVHTRKPPQRTQPKTDARGTRQGQPHSGAPNGYDAEQAQRRSLGRGQRQAQ